MPMCVCAFLEHDDLVGRKIAPFCTNEGSGMGGSERELKKICEGAAVASGLSIHGAKAAQSEGKVAVLDDSFVPVHMTGMRQNKKAFMVSLFMPHHAMNWQQHTNLFKEKHTACRAVLTALGIQMIVVFIDQAVTGFMMAKHGLPDLPHVGRRSFARVLHLPGTVLGYGFQKARRKTA